MMQADHANPDGVSKSSGLEHVMGLPRRALAETWPDQSSIHGARSKARISHASRENRSPGKDLDHVVDLSDSNRVLST